MSISPCLSSSGGNVKAKIAVFNAKTHNLVMFSEYRVQIKNSIEREMWVDGDGWLKTIYWKLAK